MSRHKLLLLLNCFIIGGLIVTGANEKLQAKAAEKDFYRLLDETFQRLLTLEEGDVSLTYRDLQTGYTLSYNGDAVYVAASTQKLATHMWIGEMIHEGKLDWDTTVAYNYDRDYEEGTGILRYDINNGEHFPLYELLEFSIIYSDNIAHSMLSHVFATDKADRYRQFFPRYLPQYAEWEPGYLSTNQLTSLLSYLYAHQKENQAYETILQFMKRTQFMERLLTNETKDYLSRTIGTNDPYFHDIGIFYHASGDYALSLMTKDMGYEKAAQWIAAVSDEIWQLHFKKIE